MKIYLAGPMSGIKDLNFPAFAKATARLRAAGHTVFSPAEKDLEDGIDPKNPPNISMAVFMQKDLPEVCAADAIALLPGWEESFGTSMELSIAIPLNKKVLCAETLKPLPVKAVRFRLNRFLRPRGQRLCKACQRVRSILDFYENRGCLASACIACASARANQRYQKNPAPMKLRGRVYYQANLKKVKQQGLARIYGAKTARAFLQLLESQSSCMICATPFSAKAVPVLDHCHTNKTLRGALCRRCNTGLGMFRDSPETLLNAVTYLKNAKSN